MQADWQRTKRIVVSLRLWRSVLVGLKKSVPLFLLASSMTFSTFLTCVGVICRIKCSMNSNGQFQNLSLSRSIDLGIFTACGSHLQSSSQQQTPNNSPSTQRAKHYRQQDPPPFPRQRQISPHTHHNLLPPRRRPLLHPTRIQPKRRREPYIHHLPLHLPFFFLLPLCLFLNIVRFRRFRRFRYDDGFRRNGEGARDGSVVA